MDVSLAFVLTATAEVPLDRPATRSPGLRLVVAPVAICGAAGPGSTRPIAGSDNGTSPGDPIKLIPRSAR